MRPVIHPGVPTPQATIEMLRGLATANIGDALQRLHGSTGLRPMHGRTPLLGRALTVRVREGDNLLIYAALQMVQPGDVLVVDGGGDTGRALMGEIMARIALSKGCVGLVIDGAVRDLAFFEGGSLPCFARAVCLRGPYKNGPGEVNVPVTVGGLTVAPGDIVAGDPDGVIAVAPQRAAKVAAGVRAVVAHETEILQALDAGRWNDDWVAPALAKAGVGAANPQAGS